MITVYVVVADFGLNGSSCLAIYWERPDQRTLDHHELGLKSVHRYIGLEVFEMEIKAP